MGVSMRAFLSASLISLTVAAWAPASAWAWGDEGHMIVAAVAQNFLEPGVRDQMNSLLSADTDELTHADFASRATWADKYRDSDRHTTKQRYNATHLWHFVDIELDNPNLETACFNFPKLPAGTTATKGTDKDCVVDKINQFKAELANSRTAVLERIIAFKFVLHFVGDVHQPLHTADDHDQGGNKKFIIFGRRTTCAILHSYWDDNLVLKLGHDHQMVADELANEFRGQSSTWMTGEPSDWAQESFQKGRDFAYKLGTAVPNERNEPCFEISPQYDDDALPVVREQLAKAGMRLAMVLNQALKR
jgi:S1/P1 Nuclease